MGEQRMLKKRSTGSPNGRPVVANKRPLFREIRKEEEKLQRFERDIERESLVDHVLERESVLSHFLVRSLGS